MAVSVGTPWGVIHSGVDGWCQWRLGCHMELSSHKLIQFANNGVHPCVFLQSASYVLVSLLHEASLDVGRFYPQLLYRLHIQRH